MMNQSARRVTLILLVTSIVFCLIVVSVFFFIKTTYTVPTINQRQYLCRDLEPGMCAYITGPVCATVAIQCITTPCEPIQETIESACTACENSLVTSFVQGVCSMPEQVINTPIVFDKRPTNFVRIGTVVFNTPGLKKNTPYFVYEEAGAPALYKELVLDEQSSCGVSGGGIPCLAMSTTFDASFGEKSALVEGIGEGNQVIVRFIRGFDGIESVPVPPPGSLFVTWPTVVRLMETCAVSSVFQSHTLDVAVSLKDGRLLRTVEPAIDEIFRVENRTRPVCGSITIATE